MSTKPLPRSDLTLLLVLALARLVLHVFLNTQYGFHRDELQVLDDARHLDWGYVPYPPLTPFLGWIELHLFGASLTGFRFFAALAQCAAMVLAGLIARELGGRRFAQIFAALATATMPFSLIMSSEFMYASFDLLWWVAIAYFALRLVNSGNARWWLALGVVFGLGLMTRYTIVFCAAGVGVGLIATQLRRQLVTPWPWFAAGIALLLFLPNLIWQARHDFVYLEFVQHIHARDIRWHRTDGYWIGQLYANTGPLLTPLWLAGLGYLVLAKDAARYRILAWIYFVALVLFAFARGRGYYLAPAYPMLLAAGCVALERWLEPLRPRAARSVRVSAGLVMALAAASSAALGLPVAPVNSAGWRLARSAHDNFAEQIGWPEYVEQVAAIYRALPESERAHAGIFANNYGEAAAVNLYGLALGLPTAISGVNTYWYRGFGDAPQTLIVLGDDADGVADAPADCVLAGRLHNSQGVENEESRDNPEIYVCRNLRVPWPEIWKASRKFG